MNNVTLTGIIAYPVTPFFQNNGDVNIPTLNVIIDDLIKTDVAAIAALGSAGESAYLEEDEWQHVAICTVDHVAGRVPVMIGISELTTQKAIQRAQFAQQAGAAAVMISPLSYYALSEQEIYQHYHAISDAIDIPIMLYNNPATSGIDMSPEFMISMIDDIKNVQMIKESTGDIQRMHRIFSLTGGKVPFYNGCNYLALEALNAGAAGWCTAAPCLIGNKPKQLFDCIQQGAALKARDLFYQQLDLLEFIVKKGLAASVKAGLALRGIDAGTARRPLLALPDSTQQELKKLMHKAML